MPPQDAVIVDSNGKPVRKGELSCPRCGAGAGRIVETSGFGGLKTLACQACGFENFETEISR